MRNTSRPIKILLIEDDDGDALIIQRQLAKSDSRVEVFRAHDGGDAIALLEAGAVKPAIILLDLNMPGVDGHEPLRRLRSTPKFANTPVVILTTSGAPTDIERAYARHANAYVQKPSSLSALNDVVDSLRRFWTETVVLPAHALSY